MIFFKGSLGSLFLCVLLWAVTMTEEVTDTDVKKADSGDVHPWLGVNVRVDFFAKVLR